MPYDENLAERVREALADVPSAEEKKMFRGVTFMVNDKMCITVSGDELMCRVDPEIQDEALKKKNSRQVIMKGKPMAGWIKVSQEGLKNKKDLDYWIGLCLAFNKQAKSSKKPVKKKK
jgi:TfoX/Sxy family transcriptional regulator of competence genes